MTSCVERVDAILKTFRGKHLSLAELNWRISLYNYKCKADSEADSEPVLYVCSSSKRFGLMVENDGEKIQSKQIKKKKKENP